jgi:two-component system, sensor histidine kinase
MLATSLRLARAALDAAPDAMIIIDPAGVIRFANRQMSALFGYAHDDVIGKQVELLMPQRFRSHHPTERETYVRNKRFRPMGAGLELFGQRQDGSEFPVEISLSPIDDEDSGQTLVAAAIRDVTDRKRAEAELTSARNAAEAARRVADSARDSADRANQAKSRFLATASHDLRQPLQTLSLLNGTLWRMVRDSDAAMEVVAQQEQAVSAMSRLLNALLDISKLESGAVKPDPSDFMVSTLFEELRREFASLADSKGLKLQVTPCEDSVHSDPSLVAQVLRNLMSNAIRYTREGWVALRCLHEQPGLVRIEVLDSGIGIPASQLHCIYDEFFQVSETGERSREGYGLGLTIVRRIATLLNLDLEVRSAVGKGTVFAFTLPASHDAARQQPSQAQPRQPVAHARARILLVEDDPAVRVATRMLLKSDGYDVATAVSLREALEHADHDSRIDLLITDYHLDAETGTQVIAALRQRLKRQLKAVLMTGDTSSAIAALPPDPLTRVTSKPVNAEELLQLLQELLAE